MLIFTSLDGTKSEPCFTYSEYEKLEELNGTMQLSFSVPSAADNTAAFSILDYETKVEDEDGHTYIVKQISSSHTRKTVTAIHEYFALSDTYFHDTLGSTQLPIKQLFTSILAGTGFTATFDDYVSTATVQLFNVGQDYVTTLIDELCGTLDVERKITGPKTIHFAKRVGEDAGTIFEYGYNIKTLEYDVDTTGLKTVIRGLSDKLQGATVYTSPNAAKFGLREQTPFEDNEITTTAAMTAALKAELNDEPEVTISLDVLTLDAQVGDTVLLLHDPLGLHVTTRVLERTTLRNYSASSITIGNTKRVSLGEALAEQAATVKTNERYTRSRFEQTRDRITAEVEAVGETIATLEIKADKIQTSVKDLAADTSSKFTQTANSITTQITDAKNGLESKITQTASSLTSEIADAEKRSTTRIQQTATGINATITDKIETVTQTTDALGGRITATTDRVTAVEATASGLKSTVSAHTTQIGNFGTRISTAESNIRQHADEIDLRVQTKDFTGDTLVGKINLTSTTATIAAKNINLRGAVTVLSDLTGDLGTITAGTIKSVNLESVHINSGTINIDTNARIGNRLDIGSMSSTATKSIYFNNSVNITAGGGSFGADMTISCDVFRLHGLSELDCDADLLNFNNADEITFKNGMYSVSTRTSGLTLAMNNDQSRVYVGWNNSDVGFLEIKQA